MGDRNKVKNPPCDILDPSTANITTMRKSLNHARYLLDQYSLVIIMKIQTTHKAMANIKLEEKPEAFDKGKNAWPCCGELTVLDYDFIFMTLFYLYSKFCDLSIMCLLSSGLKMKQTDEQCDPCHISDENTEIGYWFNHTKLTRVWHWRWSETLKILNYLKIMNRLA